jgi:peptide/nickel transport system substrate-binding protein
MTLDLNRRKFLIGGAGVGAASFLIAACGSGATTPAAGSSSAGGSSTGNTTLLAAVAALPTGFSFDSQPSGYENMEFNNNTQACLLRNPYVTSARDAKALTQNNYKWEGVLAESYEVSDDGKEYTFHLRKGVVSQQGNPFTAQDVLWSYQRKYNSTSITPFVSSPAISNPAKQWSAPDDYTVKMMVDRESDGFTLLALLANVTAEIYDSTYLKKNATKSDPYALNISNTKGNFGYGAYMLDSFTAGQQMILTANEHYALGAPKIKKVIQRVVADAGTRANILQQGAVDIAVQLRPEDVVSFASDSKLQTFEVDTNDYLWITLNTAKGVFKDVRVRQAFQKAIPYDQIIANVYKGRADKMQGWLDPTAPGYSTAGLFYPAYDPAGAKALLKEAGMSTVDMSILIASSVPDLEEACVQIRSFAAAAGFNVTISQAPAATVSARESSGDFDAYMIRDMAISLSPPYELLLEYTKDSPLNDGKWYDDAYYAAVAKGIGAGDPLTATAGKYWAQAMGIALDQVPQVSVCRVQPLQVFAANVSGYAHRSDNIIDYSIISKS